MAEPLRGPWDRWLGGRGQIGPAPVVDHRKIVAETLKAPPKKYGVTHWSSRLLCQHLKISNGTVAKAWRDYGVAPWRVETFKFSTDPELVAKVNYIVGVVLGAAGERDRAVHRRKVQDPGPGPDRPDAADAARTAGTAHP